MHLGGSLLATMRAEFTCFVNKIQTQLIIQYTTNNFHAWGHYMYTVMMRILNGGHPAYA
jgi:hypothetical protein